MKQQTAGHGFSTPDCHAVRCSLSLSVMNLKSEYGGEKGELGFEHSVSGTLFFIFLQIYFYSFMYLFMYLFLFLVALGVCCCTWALSSCGEWGPLFAAVCGLPTAVASLAAEHRL